MSFQFNWPDFDPTFYAEAKQQLETALNKEKKSKHIADYIFVKELNMGSKPPELEILEICELSTDYFRGIFKLTYCGDAFIELKTKIQANPLHSSPSPHSETNHYRPQLPTYSRPSMVTAAQPLLIPMLLRISDVQLNGIIVLSVSKTKGITLVFKNDTLTRLQVNSTFDIVSSIKSYLQQQIESQLRTFLHDTFPLVVHEYSLRHIRDRPPEPLNASLFSRFLQQQQQQYSSTNNTMHFCDASISGNTTNTIPDLTPSSSDCYSDTTSECMSCDDIDVDNNFLATPPLPPTNRLYQFKTDTDNTMTTSRYPTSLTTKNTNQTPITYTNMHDYSTHHPLTDQHHYDYDLCFTPSLSRSSSFICKRSSCVYQFNNDDDKNTNISDQQTHYLDDDRTPPPVIGTFYFDQPILISTDESHRLIQRMMDLSASSQTLAIDIDNSSRAFSVHKTAIMAGNILPGLHQRKKIPKRRIIKWNS